MISALILRLRISSQPTAGSGDEGLRQNFIAYEVASYLGLEGISVREMRKCAFQTPSPLGDAAAKRRKAANRAAATRSSFPVKRGTPPKNDGKIYLGFILSPTLQSVKFIL